LPLNAIRLPIPSREFDKTCSLAHMRILVFAQLVIWAKPHGRRKLGINSLRSA